MRSPGSVVQVVEATRRATVEDPRPPEGKKSIVADRPASSVDGTRLSRRAVELELVVCDDRPDSTIRISENAVLECHYQSAFTFADVATTKVVCCGDIGFGLGSLDLSARS